MAVHKSTLVTRQESGLLSPIGLNGNFKKHKDLITLSGAIADNDVIVTNILIPVDAVIGDIICGFDDLGTTGDLNIGLYNGETDVDDLVHTVAIDEDCFAVAVDVNAAAVVPTNYRFSALGIETVTQKAWELAGLSAKPTTYNFFRLCFTASEATTAGGDILVSVEYSN